MSLGKSLTDSKLKTPIKKALAFLSPLLIVSAGLHGLAMLLPVPEPTKIVEEDPELPESIQVSELPEVELPEVELPEVELPEIELLESEPVFAPVPKPEPPPIIQQPPAVQQPVVIQPQPAPPQPIQQPVQQPPVQQPVTQPATSDPLQDPPEKQTPVGKDPTVPAGSNSVVRNYVAGDRTNMSYLSAFATALGEGIYSDGTSLEYKQITDGTLQLTLPAGDNCFPKAEPVDASSVKLKTSLGVIVSEDSDPADINSLGSGFVRYISLAAGTGHIEANDLISEAARDSDDFANEVDTWLRTAVGSDGAFPFQAKGESLAYLIWSVEVTFTDHSCPDSAPAS